MPKTVRERVEKRRRSLRSAGLRPLQIWVADTRKPGFADECCRQSRLVAEADAGDRALQTLLDASLVDLNDTFE